MPKTATESRLIRVEIPLTVFTLMSKKINRLGFSSVSEYIRWLIRNDLSAVLPLMEDNTHGK